MKRKIKKGGRNEQKEIQGGREEDMREEDERKDVKFKKVVNEEKKVDE